MANFALLWKARIIEKYRSEYEKEKSNSVLQTNVEVPKNTLMQKWSYYSYNTKKRLVKKFKHLCPEGSSVSNLLVYLTTDQTFPNFLMKSVIGFIGGIVFTYLCFMFFVFQLSISLMHATIMSSIIGVLLTLGLAFSYRVRCLVFLLIPQFFSRVGRYTLTCYALVLILTGPATNTLKNSEILSESMACHQEQIKTSVKDITDSIENPFNAMKDRIETMTEGIKGIAKKLKTTLVKTHRLVISIANVLESSFPWLNSITKKCNQKLGTPYKHCVRMLNLGGSRLLRSKVPRFFNYDYLAEVSCQSLKRFKRIFEIADYTRTTIVATMKRKFKSFATRVQSLLCVKIHVHHSYSFSSNASRSASQVAAGIVTEIRNRADPLLTWLSWSSCVTSLFLLLIIFRAKKYQHMYDTRSRFDNRYITKELRNLDFERLKEGKETVLPLNRREKAKYITTTSFRLLASEKIYLTRSIVHMVITTFKLLIHMAADYSLYWVLMTIRYHERFQTPLQPGPTNAGVHVSGNGPVAEMLRSLIGFLTLPLSAHPSSTVSCLPNPDPPDLYRYTQIGVLIFLLWFFALFEPYGLRLSHVIMGHYRPERAKARALWLYNHILKSRGGFMKFARRKLHKEYKYFKKDEHTFVEWLDSFLPCWWLRCLLGTVPKAPNCLLCGTVEEPNKLDSILFRCDTLNCPGVYCQHCFNDLGQLCTICLNPVDYGDLSDVSLEKGSSEDSDCQDFDDQMDAEDDENFKQDHNAIDKPKNICERFELLPKKHTDAKDWFLSRTKSKFTEEDSYRFKNGRRPLAELNGNQRKENILQHFHDGYHFDVKFETNLLPLSVSSKQYSNLYPSSTYYPTSVDEKVEKHWRISKHNVKFQLDKDYHKRSKENKENKHSRRLYSKYNHAGDNFKYRRKTKGKIDEIKQKPNLIDYLRSKISKMQFRRLNLFSTSLSTLSDSKYNCYKSRNHLHVLTSGCSDYPSPRSSYYEIKFKASSLSVCRVAQSNNFAKNLRHNYKSIIRCSSKDRRSNSRLFANETDYCSCDYNFIEPQNVSDYCKSSCFIKSNKSETNSKQTLDNKKSSKTPQDESNKEEVSKTNEGNDNATNRGDKQEPNKPDSKSTCRCIKRMRRLCFCRHRKFSFTPCSVFKRMFRSNKKISPRSQKTNHKKRKKNNSHSSSRKSDENVKEDEAARIYRLSEYIGQQDWKKTQFSKSNHLELKKRKIFRTNSAKSLHRLKLHSGSKMVDVVNISKAKQKKNRNNRKLINAIEDVIAGQETDIELKSNSKKMTITTGDDTTKTPKSLLTHKWFNNYYSLLPNTSSFSLRTIMKAKRAANSVSDYGMSRSLRYYCSIGNTEFDQIDWPDAFKTRGLTKHLLKKEEGILKSLKGESEASPYHSCCCSSEDISKKYLNNFKHYQPNNLGTSSVTFNFKTEFEMLSKPVRGIKLKSIKHAMSDRFLHLRLRNPLPLVRDFYSSMLDAKMRKTHGKENDGKCKAVTVHPRRKSATCQCDGVCDTDLGDCPNYEFKKERGESTNRRPMLDTSCETRELLVQKPELSKTSTGNQAAFEMNRREYPTSTSNNSLSTVNIRSMSFLIVQKSREQPSNTDPMQKVETVNKSVDTSHSVLRQRNEITNTTPMHNKTHTAVGSSHFVETVYRPVETGIQPSEYLQGRNVSSTCHKQMELNKTVSTYTPRKVQMTNHQKPYIFRPTHNETNCPEDPTHPEPAGLASPRIKGDDHNSFQTRQRTVASSGTNNYEDAGSEWERQYQKHCQENEALDQERKRRLQREDNRNRLDNRITQGVPKRDSLTKIRKRSEKNSSTNKSDNYESCFQTERHCPSNDSPVIKNSRDVYTSPQRIASRISRDRYPSNDRQFTNERIGNSNIERILSRNSVYDRNPERERHPSSYDRFSPVYDRLLGHDRYANFERRNSRIPHEIQESYLGRDSLGPDRQDFQNVPINVPERLERKELSRRERKMRDDSRKPSKRGLDAAEQVDCECAEVAKKTSKGTGKGDTKKFKNSKAKTKTAICQCPPSPMLRTPKLTKMKSDTRISTDEDMDLMEEVRTASRCSLRGGRTYTKMISAATPSSFPRMTRARSASCTWNVQSESEIGDPWSHEMRRSVYTTTSKLFEREPSRTYGVPTSMDCNGCSDNKSLSSQSSRVSCSKSSCCSCPSNKRSKCHSTKQSRKKSQKDKVLTKVISDIIETSAFQSSQWAADEDVDFEGRNAMMSKDDECSDSDDSDDQDEVRIIPSSKNEYRKKCENPLKVECYPKPQCHKSKQSETRRPKRKTTVYQPTQAPTSASTNRLIARRQRNPCSPCDLGQRGSCLSRLTEYPSSADVMDHLSAKRACRQSRKCPSDIQCGKKSPTDHCAVIKKRQSETSPCNNETSDCTMCMKKASQGTRETASGETSIRPRCILYQKDPSKSKHGPCSDCQCHKKKKSYNVCQVPTQTLQQWPTHNIETEEIKGYLRSLCRNCQCEKSYAESQSHNPQAQSKVWVSPNKSSDLRGYLQTTWRNCQCGKIKTVVETINKSGTRVNSNCITTAPIIQTLSTTTVGTVAVDNSALSVCRNCQCIKKKLGQKNNNTPVRMKKSYDQTEAQRRTNNLSAMDLRRYEDFVRNTSSYVAPSFKDQIVPESSYDDLNAEYDTKPVKNKTSIEASTLVKQIEKAEIPEIPSVNSLPSIDEPIPNHLIAELKETKKERNVKTTGCTTGTEFQKIDKYVSAVTKMKSTYNESKHAIFVSDVDTCCSIDELKRNYSRGCNKKSSCHGPCKPSSKRKGKKCVDRSQIFPEKLSCGVESRREETSTKRFPSDSRTRDQEYKPRGCVPYKPPPGTAKDTCERGNCFPSPCDSEKKCCADAKPEKSLRRKDSDRRVTVNSKVKTIEPPSPCPPEPIMKKCEEEPTQKTRVIEVKPKESIKSITQECGCTGAPPAPQRSVSKEKPKKKVDKSSSAHRVKKPHTDECKPKPKPIPTLKPKPSCEEPSKHNIKNTVVSDTKKTSTERRRRRDDCRGTKINTSLSDTQTSRARLRSSSNDSRMRPPSRQTSKLRNKSAPCNYRKSENENNVKNNAKTVPSQETTPSKGPSEEKIPIKPKSDSCEPKVCSDTRKIVATTRDVAVDIRCPICTCATQCHGTRCYRSTDIINPNLKVKKEEVESQELSLEDDALFSDYTSEEITDTTLQSRTVCSRVAIEYCEKVPKLKHPCKTCCKSIEKIRRIKKVNKGTCTKSRRLKDVGTITKACKSDQIQRRCCRRNKGICTEGKLVTFKSCTQIIPPCCRDIMSPSRYLLESQRHYNEMFSSKYLHTNMCPAFVSPKQGGFCASKVKRNSQRGYKVKKPEHHSLRRQTSPRVSEDRTRSDDSTRPAIRLLKGMRRYRLRNEAKLTAVRKQKWQRHAYESPTNKILTQSQQNLCLQYGAAEDKSSSLAGHCNSASSF